MARKKKAKFDVEHLRYLGLGFNPEESSTTPSVKGQAHGIQFVPPVVHVSPAVNEKKPQGSATSIDVPLSPWTRGAKEELCLETLPATLLQEEESLSPSEKSKLPDGDPHVYVP